MLQDLAFRATRGDEPVEPDTFFQQHKLDAKPLTDWFRLSESAKIHLLDALGRRGVDLADDVRPRLTEDLYAVWTIDRPVLVLAGEGGRGKTWLGYCLLLRASADEAVSLLVESPGNERDALSEAAARFWNEIVGQDEAPPFVNVRSRLRSLGDAHKDRELCILFDGVTDIDVARRLVLKPWDEWGVRVILTCPNELAPILKSTVREFGTVTTIGDFSVEELHEYLEESVGPDWPSIPHEIRNTLRHPLLARLYRDAAGTAEWQPTREYDLYQRCWDDLVSRRGVRDLDLVPLMAAALTLIDGATYPWSRQQLAVAGMSPESLERLQRSGWLRTFVGPSFEVWHDRLLNWTFAEALIEKLRSDPQKFDEIIAKVCSILVDPRIPSGRMLGFVPMDFLWLLISSPPSGLSSPASAAIDAMVSAIGAGRAELLFEELLPTLGPRIIPELVSRLESKAIQGMMLDVRVLSSAVATVGGMDAIAAGRRLLGDDRPMVQRAGLGVLKRCPDAAALDRIWEIHSQSYRDQSPYLYPNEQKWSLYEDTFGALKACAALSPSWIVGAVGRADPATEPVYDLGYLLANVGENSHWESSKDDLFAKVVPSHERSLASCVLRFYDHSRIQWLEDRITPTSNVLGAVCLRALIRLDVDRAFRYLERLGEGELYLSRSWCFAEFLARDRKRTLQYFHEKLLGHTNPWGFAQVLQGQENLIEPRSLEVLLDALARGLETDLERSDGELAEPRIVPHFAFLLELGDPKLLECLRSRRQQPLERRLTEWLLARGPQEGEWLERDKYDGLRTLSLIGGTGLSKIVRAALETADRHGKHQAIQFAERCRDSESEDVLVRLSQSDELWDGHKVIQSYAARALAARGAWRSVVCFYAEWGLEALEPVGNSTVAASSPADEP
jgi:hypothetical protein